MIKNHLRRLYSWLLGRKIGQFRYCRSSPACVGDPDHMLLEIVPGYKMTDEQKRRYWHRVDLWEWTGWKWEFLGVWRFNHADLEAAASKEKTIVDLVRENGVKE